MLYTHFLHITVLLVLKEYLTCKTMSRVCSNASGHRTWTAGSTGRVHFTRAGASLKFEGQTIRAIKTVEETLPSMVCNK